MISQVDWDRQTKNQVREHTLPHSRVLSSVWLPGQQCIDLKQAMAQKLLLPGDHILVEREGVVAKAIRRYINGKGFKFNLQQTALHRVQVETPLQYVHLDMLGALGTEEAVWINRMPIARNAEVNFTFSYEHRRRASCVLRLWQGVIQANPLLKKMYQEEYYDQWRHDPVIATYQTVLRCLLRRYSFTVKRPILYRDVQRMVVYSFHEFRPLAVSKSPNILSQLRESPFTERTLEIEMATPQVLVESYGKIRTSHDLRGWKRSCTVYCKNQSRDTGTPPRRFLAAIKMRLTKNNYDLTPLVGYNVS